MTQTTKTTKETTDEFTTTETQRETITNKEGLDNKSVQYSSHPDLSVTEKITDLDITPDTSEYGRQRSDSSSSSSSSEEGVYHIQQDPVDTEPGQRKLESIQELIEENQPQSSSGATSVGTSVNFEDEMMLGYSEGSLTSTESELVSQQSSPPSSMESSQHHSYETDQILERRSAENQDLAKVVSEALRTEKTTIDDDDQQFKAALKEFHRVADSMLNPEESQKSRAGSAGEPRDQVRSPSTERVEKFLTETKQQVSSDHQASQKAASGEASSNTQPLDTLAKELVDKALHNVMSEKEFQQTSTREKSEPPAAGQYTEHVEPRITQKTEQLRDLKLPSNEAMKPAETTEPQETEISAGDIAEAITSKEKDIDQSLEKMVDELVSEDSANVLSDERERHKSSIATGSSSDVELLTTRTEVISDLDESKHRPQTDEDIERISASMRKEHLKSKRTTTTISVYMKRTESHKTEVKANVVPGRATEQQSIEHSVRSQITVGSTTPKKQVKWDSSVDPASSSVPKEAQQQEEPLKTEAASASGLAESVTGAERAAEVGKPSASSDDLRTRNVKVTYKTYGTYQRTYEEKTFPAGSSIDSLQEWLNETRVKFKRSYLGHNAMQVEVTSKIKDCPDSRLQFAFDEGKTTRVKARESDATRASVVSPTFKQTSESLLADLKSAEAKADSDTPRV